MRNLRLLANSKHNACFQVACEVILTQQPAKNIAKQSAAERQYAVFSRFMRTRRSVAAEAECVIVGDHREGHLQRMLIRKDDVRAIGLDGLLPSAHV